MAGPSSVPVTLTWTATKPPAPTPQCSAIPAYAGQSITCVIVNPSPSWTYAWPSGQFNYDGSGKTTRTGPATGLSTTYRSMGVLPSATWTQATSEGVTAANSYGTSGGTWFALKWIANTPTAATVSCDRLTTPATTAITCTASGSTSPDGSTPTYQWSPVVFSNNCSGPSSLTVSPTVSTGSTVSYTSSAMAPTSCWGRSPGTIAATPVNAAGISGPATAVSPTWTNDLPSAPSVTCTPNPTPAGTTITCSASGAVSPDGGAITYHWSDGGYYANNSGYWQTTRTSAETGPTATYMSTTSRTRDGYGAPMNIHAIAYGNNAYADAHGLKGASSAPVTLVWQ